MKLPRQCRIHSMERDSNLRTESQEIPTFKGQEKKDNAQKNTKNKQKEKEIWTDF